MKPASSSQQACLVHGLLLFVGSAILLWTATYLAGLAGGWIPHAVSHLSASMVGALVLFGSRQVLRQVSVAMSHQSYPDARVLTAGILIFTLAQLVEAASAVIEYPQAGALHDMSGLVTMVGLLVFLLGMVIVVFRLVHRGTIPRWGYVLLVGLALLGIFMLLTAVMGLG